MIEQVHQLIRDIKYGTMSSLAYDTAWVARLGDIDQDLSNEALEWLCSHQLSDGSWGAEHPFYYHDRVISTLAAMIALSHQGRRSMDKKMIERGLIALERITNRATQGLQADPNGATVGFEMIVPILVREAEELGIIKQQGDRILGRLAKMRAEKITRLKGRRINKYMTAAFSAEMAGRDGIDSMLEVENLQESNGSIGHSPSASAYYALLVKPGDNNALDYLRLSRVEDGGFCDLYPFDIFERAWVLWNLSLIPQWDPTTTHLLEPHLNHLFHAWKPGIGVSFSAYSCVPVDGDDIIFTFDVLKNHQIEVDIDAVLALEEENYFRCYDLEVGVSPSVNIHALKVLLENGYSPSHPSVQKIVKLLENLKIDGAYWTDKWQVSPFYTLSHFIIACAGYLNEMAMQLVEWMLSCQNSDGSWGHFSPTLEETSHCLQALCIWKIRTNAPIDSAIRKGYTWLKNHFHEDTYPPLWIGKGLYCPTLIVRSSILSALMLAEGI